MSWAFLPPLPIPVAAAGSPRWLTEARRWGQKRKEKGFVCGWDGVAPCGQQMPLL